MALLTQYLNLKNTPVSWKSNNVIKLKANSNSDLLLRKRLIQKSTGYDTPIKIFQKSDFCFDERTYCMNHNLIKEKFSSKLKNANVTPAYNKDDPTSKVNF